MEPAIAADILFAFTVASFLIELTPGPNMTYLALVGARDGLRAGFATVAGVALGLGILGLIAALGVAELLQSSPLLYEILRWSGVVFLLFLAWEGWSKGADIASAISRTHGYFIRGLVTNLLNPKAAIFYIAVLPTFIEASRPILVQSITLSGVYVAVATAVHAGIVLAASSLEPFLNDPKRERLARRVLSGMLALVAVWFGWSTAR